LPLQQAHFRTAEAVACGVAQLLIAGCGVAKCTVKVVKPSSLLYAQGAGVEVTRTCKDFPIGFARCVKESRLLGKGATEFGFPAETVRLQHKDDQIFIRDLLVRYACESVHIQIGHSPRMRLGMERCH
jgi:hypothetical protein